MFHALGELMELLGIFGGVALIILAKSKARIEMMRAERQMWQQPAQIHAPGDTAVAAELRALRQQVAEMQSTGHQFDLSFDAALGRLENRVDRLETRSVAQPATPTAADAPQALRNGVGS